MGGIHWSKRADNSSRLRLLRAFWFNCSDDTPQHLKPIPPCLLRRMAKNNDFLFSRIRQAPEL